MNDTINVLDKGYVRLVNVMGSDLTVVNAARVSYAKESKELSDRDVSLIKFLAREGHTSPFRHAMAQFEVYAPLMVARQWWKYQIGSAHMEGTGDSLDAWNESSRRYVTEEPAFYIPEPDEWRSAPENSKQGSGEPIDEEEGFMYMAFLKAYISQGEQLYKDAIKSGVCAEQARLFLPAYGMYVRWYWTASLQSICHFLNQRLEHDAQKEIQEYAKAILTLIESKFPISIDELIKKNG
ncbi:thymidylate synthase, flavin-dependent [Paenibacillus sp. FSL H7-0326]|uniref:FAD-dependent thymidylate synthase n=1 Tax=Paenibacillus sp. FSL H7-0326 TaxID=1921144 RepID=UPI00096F72E2|nr:FAD-dependent thymidylate synthase [Paenibacillus sp. FSL H7-0326]OMC71116.1 thymidylate synthase, flavin-dependent [Paenibacillus sp. FSL H7-0326]